MFLNPDEIRRLEHEYGPTRVLPVEQEVGRHELAMVRASSKHGRAHDVTMFIMRADRLVVIRKPMFPPDAFRAPSGGVHPGEDILTGVKREAREETGLEVEVERYLLRAQARFWSGDDGLEWTSHVFLTPPRGEHLAPIDTEEIAEARWASLAELTGELEDALRRDGRGLFQYRIWLHRTVADMLTKP